MKYKRLTEEQIVAVLKEHEIGAAADLGRKHGISPQTLYNGKNKYGAIFARRYLMANASFRLRWSRSRKAAGAVPAKNFR